MIIQVFFFSPGVRLLNFWNHLLNERLSTKTGIYCHDEQEIDFIQKGFYGGDIRGGIDGQADLFSKRSDFTDERINFITEFHMNGDRIRSCFDKGIDKNFRAAAHEMDIQ